MNVVPIEDFLPLVLPFARGASEPAAIAEIRNAAIHFCAETKVWREMLEPQSLTAGSRDVELPLPDDADLVGIAEVWYHRNVLDPAAEDDLKARGIDPKRTGTPECYTHYEDLFILRVAPTPIRSEAQCLYIRAILQPTRTAENVPDVLFRRYGNDIAQGALARLHGYDEAWADKGKATDKRGEFEVSIAGVKHKVSKSNTRVRRRVTPAYF